MLIAENPTDSRRALSVKLCMAWNWVQANGAYRDMVCRSFMLMLHRQGHIKLPEKRRTTNNPLANRKRPPKSPAEIKYDIIGAMPGQARHLQLARLTRSPARAAGSHRRELLKGVGRGCP